MDSQGSPLRGQPWAGGHNAVGVVRQQGSDSLARDSHLAPTPHPLARDSHLAPTSAGIPSRDRDLPPIALTVPDAWARARRELELLEFPITIDPFTFLGRDDQGRDIDWSRYTPVNQLCRHLGRRVHVCGIMVADRINVATTGELMKFVTLADRTGFVETILFPDTYRRLGHLTVTHPIVAATGIVESFENNRGFTLRVQHLSVPLRRSHRGDHGNTHR